MCDHSASLTGIGHKNIMKHWLEQHEGMHDKSEERYNDYGLVSDFEEGAVLLVRGFGHLGHNLAVLSV